VEIAAGAREARYVVLLVLALAAPAILGWLSIQAISGRGPIACYVPAATHESAIPDGQESP
jgi:hypothetical protein